MEDGEEREKEKEKEEEENRSCPETYVTLFEVRGLIWLAMKPAFIVHLYGSKIEYRSLFDSLIC